MRGCRILSPCAAPAGWGLSTLAMDAVEQMLPKDAIEQTHRQDVEQTPGPGVEQTPEGRTEQTHSLAGGFPEKIAARTSPTRTLNESTDDTAMTFECMA